LAKRHAVQLHLTAKNANSELSLTLRRALENAVEVHYHPLVTRRGALLHAFRLACAIRRFDPDVVHGQEAGDWSHAIARSLCGRRPFVYTVHDPQPHTGTDLMVAHRNRWPRLVLRRSAEAIIVHGASMIGPMKALARSGVEIAAIPHGFLGEPTPPRARLGNGFVFLGRIEAYKGLDVLLDAMDVLAIRGQPARLSILGRGPGLEALRERIAAMPCVMLDEAFITPELLPRLLAAARAVVLPYRDATQSGVLANAFAAGVPVIASRVGGLADVVADGGNGLLVPAGNAQDLASAMARLAADDNLATSLAQGAADTAMGVMSWDNIATQTCDVYERHHARTRARGKRARAAEVN
jgi:glycosyltransferase involved in cell wall biosynthesis